MATAAEQTLAEVTAALEKQEPLFEGLLDFARLNLAEGTADIIKRAIRQQDHRRGLLGLVKQALENLLADGYPGTAQDVIDADAYADLQEQVRTITEALTRFTPNAGTAANLNPTAGTVEPKPTATRRP